MGQRLPSFFFMKKNMDANGDFKGWIWPDVRFSSRNSSSSFCSFNVRLYILQLIVWSLGSNSTVWSHSQLGSNLSKLSLSNMSLNSW